MILIDCSLQEQSQHGLSTFFNQGYWGFSFSMTAQKGTLSRARAPVCNLLIS